MNTETQVKVAIVAEWIKTGCVSMSKAQFAREKGISPRTLSRYIDAYEAEAEIMTIQQNIDENQPEVVNTQAVDHSASNKTIGAMLASEETTEKEEEVVVERNPKKKQNGRWAMLNSVFSEHGLETKSSELFDIVNEVSTRQGMEPLKKSSFYAMLSIARKAAGISMRNKD